jgi:hypothetical protein
MKTTINATKMASSSEVRIAKGKACKDGEKYN